jgi:multidrug efflux pump subunit AcrA (membrane-fusion protein)
MATVEILIPNADSRLKPGMYAEVEITTGIIRNTIVVPRHAVLESTSLERQNGDDIVVRNYFVYIIDDSSYADQRLLDVQHVNHQNIAVRSGIEIGEKLVISGQNNLRDGIPVLPTQNEEIQ